MDSHWKMLFNQEHSEGILEKKQEASMQPFSINSSSLTVIAYKF